ncbi:MAG: IS1634 family transposase, partial [Candidatus Kuenenia sp.]|nr:IS1634 family transposase [Candidatus Kuenenia hertensis]
MSQLRESYREDGKVKKRTIANLSNCTTQEIAAIKLALAHKDDLSAIGGLSESVELHEGLSVGAVWSVYRVAKELGIDEALGKDFEGKLALWQVMARVIDLGSRLSAVRLAQVHAAGDVLDLKRGF